MKQIILIIVCSTLILFSAFAEKHPMAGEIEAYISENGYGTKVQKITYRLSDRSNALNEEGYNLYTQEKYDAALAKFKQAISADDGNSIAYYNAACVMALQYAIPSGGVSKDSLLPVIVRYLYQAMERDPYWALQMMIDSDLYEVRHFSSYYGGRGDQMARTIYSDYEWGGVWTSFGGDGTAVNVSGRQDWNEMGGLGKGYYCIIGGYIFEYMGDVEFGMVNQGDTSPASMYPVEECLPRSVSSGR